MKFQAVRVMVHGIEKVYPHKDCSCYYKAYSLHYLPEQDEGILGGFFDELFTLKKGKKYKITVEEIK